MAAARRGALRRRQRGGPWGERLITLTIPHVYREALADGAFAKGGERFQHLPDDELVLSMRVHLLFVAWRHFALAFNRHWRERTSHAFRPVFYRAFEWTPGHDCLGHPHFHVWAFSPFVDVEEIRTWWNEALKRAGLLFAPGVRVIVDVKLIRTRPGELSRELIKGGKRSALALSTFRCDEGGNAVMKYADGWSLSDVASESARVPARLVARLYEALEGRHVAHASKGLLEDKPLATCPDCHATGTLRVRLHPVELHSDGRQPTTRGRAPPAVQAV